MIEEKDENKDEKPELTVLEGEADDDDDLDDEDEGDEDEEGDDEGVNVYTVYLVDSPLPVPAIDTREHVDLLADFGNAVANKANIPFFAFTGDPDEGYVGMALVRIDQVAAIQSVVTEEEMQSYLAKDEEDETEYEESAVEKAKREADEKRERKRLRKEAEAKANANKVPAGNRGKKGGKGLKGLV